MISETEPKTPHEELHVTGEELISTAHESGTGSAGCCRHPAWGAGRSLGDCVPDLSRDCPLRVQEGGGTHI